MTTRATAASIPFRRIADATYDWESWLSPDGALLWVNPAVERITGYGVDESFAMARYPLPMVVAEDRARIEQVLQTARSGSPGNDVEFRVLRKDGGVRWAAISWQSFGDEAGTSLGFRTSVRDIHERKLSETRLHEALAIAEQAAVARQAFLANTSHELRTPLQSILGYAQLLAAGEQSADARRKLDIIVQQTESLLAIVSNVLEMAALQVKAPEIVEEEFDPRRKVADILEVLRPLTMGKPLELHLHVAPRVPSRVRGDRLRVRQVLTNLIANAIKFTDRGQVDVRVSRTAKGWIRFVVEDTGIGIAREDLERVFLPFERSAEAARRGQGGTGLGLSIAKALTDAMGGTLSASARRGGGSRFTLELPLPAVEGAPGRGADARPAPRQSHRPTVLVVDDSPVGRELVREMLQGLGAEVRAAATGEEALAAVLASPPELVLMDLQMPGLDGATTAQLIRAQTPPGAPRPRIVALTANAFGRAQALGSSGGMDGYLVKPARIADLRALLDRIADEGDRADATSVVAGAQPTDPSAELDAAVIRDLASARTREGRSLLEVAGQRVLDDTPACLAEIAAAIRARRLRSAAHLAHRIKGNCLMVGASNAAACAQRLDDALARDEAKTARTHLRALTRAFGELEQALRGIIGPR